MTDRELMKKIKYQPEEGVGLAIREYGPLIKGVIIKTIGNTKEVDVHECMSQVFVRLWKYSKGFNEEKGCLKSYLVAMARNEALRALKYVHIKTQEQTLEEWDLGVEIDMTHEMAKKMNKAIIHETIKSLKEPDRQIFIRRYFWSERIKTIAIALQLDEKFVENRLYLVKKKLKQQLIDRGIIL
ncbi:MAG: sigma-70 family RNA polymerase sigma factor [Cellulosilyticaceae bacterium]